MAIGRTGFVRRRVTGGALSHTYTRQKRTQVAYDPGQAPADSSHNLWGAEQTEHATANTTIGVPCAYSENEQQRNAAEGEILVRTPTLQIAYNDPLAIGDWVLNVQTTENPPQLLFAGPGEVQSIVPINSAGPTIFAVARLMLVQAEQ